MSKKTPFEQWWEEDGAHLGASAKDMAWEAWIAALRHARDAVWNDMNSEGSGPAPAAREAA